MKWLKTVTLVCAVAIMSSVCSVLCLAEGSDHAVSVDLTGNGSGYTEVLYDNTNGLPTSEANAIAETSDGFIWIGSYSGLIRYDGNTFERYDSTTGIASVVSLFVDSQDRLWVGTNDSGIAVMDKGDVRMFNKTDGLKSLSIRAIAESEDGNIYIATTHGVSIIDSEMNLTNVEDPRISDEYVRDIMLGSDNTMYGVTMNGCVFTMKDGILTGFYGEDDLMITGIHSIVPDKSNPGYVYIGTKNSYLWYGDLTANMRRATAVNTSPLEYINSIEIGDGVVWICADNGIGMVQNGKVIVLDDLPLYSSIEKVMKDYQGNLWFASSKMGVMKIVPDQFDDIFKRYSLDAKVVNATCVYDNKLFIGTKNDGLIVIDNEGVVDSIPLTSSRTASGVSQDDTDLVEMLDGRKIRSIIKDSHDRLWFSLYDDDCLVRFDHGNIVKFTMDDGMPSSRVRTVYEKEDGTIMVACTGGLVVIKGDRITNVYDESSGISNTEILTVTEGFNGDDIIGTDGDGIYILGDGVRHINVGNGLMSDVVMRIKRDISRDVYWIVTSNSIAFMDADYNVTTISQFPYSNNFDMYENSAGDMWILSSNGIYVVPADELLANGALDPVFYGMANGLSCITTANSYSALTENGDLYISGATGVAKVNIENPFENASDLKAAVPYIDVDGVRLYPDDEGTFNVPFGARKITIYSYVFTYSLMNPQVTYHLDGFDSEETTVRRNELGPVDYTNLSGGSYRFVMKISDAMGRGDNEISVRIVKEKAFYEQIWFYAICLVFAAFVFHFVMTERVRKQTEELEKRNAETIAQNEKNKIFIKEMVEAFAKTIDMKDEYTKGHSQRVADYTKMLAEEMGLPEEKAEEYYNIALLHDIGKLGVDINILNKNGKLSDQEFALIKSHPSLGYRVLKDITIMPDLAIGAWSHHERPDGKGYPQGLTGENIPEVARIIAVADTFDAMYSDRPYRKRMNFEKAVSIIKEVSGTQLDSEVVDAFLRLVDKGEFKSPDDHGGGTTEDIDNIHKKQKEAEDKKAEENKPEENKPEDNSGDESKSE